MAKSKFESFFNAISKYALPIFIFSLICLLLPKKLLIYLDLLKIISTGKYIISLTLLISFSFIVASVLIRFMRVLGERIVSKDYIKRIKKNLNMLTPPEKQILKAYIYNETQTNRLDPGSGIVEGLAAKGILYKGSNLGEISSWDYNIQPIAYEYLINHKQILEMAK